MGNSLQEQLLQAGLVDKDQLNKANKQKRKQPRPKKGAKAKAKPVDPEVQRQRDEKAARDRELNQQREEVRRQREVSAQVRQLVRNNRHPRPQSDDDIPFNFQNKDKIKRIFVSPETHKLISSGRLVIVNDNGNFELVPPAIAEKIRQRNPSLVIDLPKEDAPAADDPYADFKVPDDLMW
jgi:hypothetical protein